MSKYLLEELGAEDIQQEARGKTRLCEGLGVGKVQERGDGCPVQESSHTSGMNPKASQFRLPPRVSKGIGEQAEGHAGNPSLEDQAFVEPLRTCRKASHTNQPHLGLRPHRGSCERMEESMLLP